LPWVRLDTSFPRNHKLLALLQEKDGYRAALVYLCSLSYSGEQGTAGFITELALPFIHGRKTDAERLVKHDFWQPCAGGWLIHDWKEHQAAGEEAEARSRRARDAAYVRWNGTRDAQLPAYA
jgi:hypothetical protein